MKSMEKDELSRSVRLLAMAQLTDTSPTLNEILDRDENIELKM